MDPSCSDDPVQSVPRVCERRAELERAWQETSRQRVRVAGTHAFLPIVTVVATVMSLAVPAAAKRPQIESFVQQAYAKASNTDSTDYFGWAVSMSGDTLVVGAPGEASSASGIDGNQDDNSAWSTGAVYVFVRTGTAWSQQAYLKASNSGAGDHFGDAVSISGDTLVVGARWESSAATGVGGDQSDDSAQYSGAAYVFVRDGTTWSQQAYLKASNTNPFDEFGGAVSVSGDTLVVGAWNEDSAATGVDGDESSNSAQGAGAAYVFVRDGTTWSQQAYLKASDTDARDSFGRSVSVSEDTVVVGAMNEDSSATGVGGDGSDAGAFNSGAAYVIVRTGTTWSQQAYLKASNTGSSDGFGEAVSVSGDTIVVGAKYEDSSATGVDGDQSDDALGSNSGAAYVFSRGGTVWSQQAYLKASDTDHDDAFGRSVSISDDRVVVGAIGAAYVFVRGGTTWIQRSHLTSSNSSGIGGFGNGVRVAGDTVVIGTWTDGSSATGLDGDGSNLDAPNSGAAYVFVLPDLGGCHGSVQPSLSSAASATTPFAIHCPVPSQPCQGPRLILFGGCSPSILEVPPPLGCGVCGFAVDPSWGSLVDGATIGSGLQPGFSFCVQCGCMTNSWCIDLSQALRITVGT